MEQNASPTQQPRAIENPTSPNIIQADETRNAEADQVVANSIQSVQRERMGIGAMRNGAAEEHFEKDSYDKQYEMASRIQAVARGWIYRMNSDAKICANVESGEKDVSGNSENCDATASKRITDQDPMLGHKKSDP